MRTLFAATVFLLACWLVTPVSLASQDPSLPLVNFSISLEDNLKEASIEPQADAGVWYMGDLFSDGPARLFLYAYRFLNEPAASAAMPIILAYQSEVTDPAEYGSLVSMSPIGDDRLALLVIRTQSSGSGTAHVTVRVGTVVFYAQTFGGLQSTDNPVSVLVPYLQGMVDRARENPQDSSDDLRALLPTYDMIPGGFTEFDAPGADFSAGPTPTPLIDQSPEGFTFSGTGDYSGEILVSLGTFRISATCSTPGGKIDLFGAADFDTAVIPEPGVTLTFQFEPPNALLSVRCEGNWTLTGIRQ